MNAITRQDLPDGAVATELPDVLPHYRKRGRIAGFARRHPLILVGGLLLGVMVFIALAAPLLGTLDPLQIAPAKRLRPPSDAAWFGTDMLGRDLYSRTLYGSRISLVVGTAVAALAATLGVVTGVLSGFARVLDPLIMRMMDGLMSIPSILLAVAFTALSKGSVTNVVIAISIAETPRVARLVRGLVLGLRDQPYIEAAVTCGSRMPTILVRHILPNIMAPLIVQMTYVCASAMITEAILSFIGAGTPPIIPSWGNIMAEGRALWQVKPFLVFFPAAFLSLTVLAVQLLGDGLRDALDPRLERAL